MKLEYNIKSDHTSKYLNIYIFSFAMNGLGESSTVIYHFVWQEYKSV